MKKCNNCEKCKCAERFEEELHEQVEYTEQIKGDTILRTFSQTLKPHTLKWHVDEQTRLVKSVNETDWQFQFDNEFPESLNREILIPKGVFHRIIKGTGDLTIKITCI